MTNINYTTIAIADADGVARMLRSFAETNDPAALDRASNWASLLIASINNAMLQNGMTPSASFVNGERVR